MLFISAYSSVGLAQSIQIPSSWFSADPKTVMSDPLFPTLPLGTRKEILSQIDPKFAKMGFERQDAFLWQAETTYLPKAQAPRQVYPWRPTDPSSTSQSDSTGVLTKSVNIHGLVVQSSVQRIGFLIAHIRIQNGTTEAVSFHPEMFRLEVLKPKRYTLFFEYPSRVSWQMFKAGANYTSTYTPMQRTTLQNGAGGTIATVDSPDPVAKKKMEDVAAMVSNGAVSLALTVEPKSLKAGMVLPGNSVEGDVYFEQSDKAQDLTLKVFLSDVAFEFPFTLARR